MVGVLHLDWIVEPDDIKAGLINDLPAILSIVQSQYSNAQLCDKFLKMNCAAQKRVVNKVKCAGKLSIDFATIATLAFLKSHSLRSIVSKN